jgi:AraC family transcriptional regulator, ethanolamine operon transcriptional activator
MAKPRRSDQSIVGIRELLSTVQAFRLELLQIDPGVFWADAAQTYLGDASLGCFRFGQGVVQTWKSPPRSITVVVRSSRASALWQGTTFVPSEFLVAGPEAEIELVSRPGFSVASAVFPADEFQRFAELHGCGALARGGECVLVRLPEAQAAREIRKAIPRLIAEGLARPSDPEWERAKRAELLHRTVLAISGGLPFEPAAQDIAYARIIGRAVSEIIARPAGVLPVAALCRTAGASEATLRHAFLKRFGLPPARFMKAYRLNGARKDLGQIDSRETTISDVANKWGFWHLGQFAKDYRLWFGELPSEACRRSQNGCDVTARIRASGRRHRGQD